MPPVRLLVMPGPGPRLSVSTTCVWSLRMVNAEVPPDHDRCVPFVGTSLRGLRACAATSAACQSVADAGPGVNGDCGRSARPIEDEWGKDMRVQIALSLPREAISVPLTRHTVSAALYTAGVEPTCVDEVEVALSEACTNAVQHAVGGVSYEVNVSISDEQVSIEVVDSGSGFGQREVPSDGVDHMSENGRGMALINALSDLTVFDSITGKGGSVHLTKRLRWIQGVRHPGVASTLDRPR
jgi:serine/threonine-protein kinase RsbW